MEAAVSTITLPVSAAKMSAVLARLTTHMLQERLAFTQTFSDGTRIDVIIFPSASDVAVSLTLQATNDGQQAVSSTARQIPPTVAADTAALLRRLLEVCVPSDNQQEPFSKECMT